MEDQQDHTNFLVEEQKPFLQRKSTWILSVTLFLTVAGLSFIAWFFWPHNYVIQGIPPATVYNHIDNDVEYFTTGMAAGIYSVMSYYGEEFTDEELAYIQRAFYDRQDESKLYGLQGLEDVAERFDYEYEWLYLTNRELRNYISKEKQVPLLFAHELILNQPEEVDFTVLGVLIGLLSDEDAVVVHDFYYGPNKKISMDVFDGLRENERNINSEGEYVNRYFFLKPKNDEYLQKSQVSPYPERTESMDLAEPLINKIALGVAIGRTAGFEGYKEVQYHYFEEAIQNPDFEEHVPPYWKALALGGASVSAMVLEGDFNKAESYLVRAEELNGTLDQPWSDYWPGFKAKVYLKDGEIDGPYYARGVLLGFQGKYQESIESYEKALDVYPYGRYTYRGIERSELRIQEQSSQN